MRLPVSHLGALAGALFAPQGGAVVAASLGLSMCCAGNLRAT